MLLVRASIPAFLALLLACRSPSTPVRPRLVQVRLQDRSGGPLRGLIRTDDLGRQIGEALAAGKLVDLALGAEARPRVDYRLEVNSLVDGEGGPQGMLRARLGARLQRVGAPPGESAVETKIQAERAYAGDLGPATAPALREHLARASTDLGRLLSQLLGLHLGDATHLLEGLRDPEFDIREEAMRVAGQRRERMVVPALIAKLSADDSRERDLAIGTLVEIGDPAAVPALTRGVRFEDEIDLTKRLDAVAAIGGPDARAFLEFVAGSHRDPEVRSLAAHSLSRLNRGDAGTHKLP